MVVHFPMALAILQPLLILALIIGIKKEVFTRKSWWIAIGAQVILVLTTFVALQTGEIDEEIVESIVDESLIESHEDIAKLFFIFSIVTLVSVILPAFLSDKMLGLGIVTLVLALVVLGVGIQVGKLGGELVYEHNAASVHIKMDKKQEVPDKKSDKKSDHKDHDSE